MPASFEALFILFFFAAPTYFAVQIYKTRNPVRYYKETQSPIEQAALYVSVSAIINFLIFLLIVFLWKLSIFFQLSNIFPLNSTTLGFSTSYNIIGILIFFFPIYLILAGLFSSLLADLVNNIFPVDIPVWIDEINKLKARQTSYPNLVTFVIVHLQNGDECLGLIKEAKWVGDKENQIELVLSNAVYKSFDNNSRVISIGRILLRSKDILWLSPYFEKIEQG